MCDKKKKNKKKKKTKKLSQFLKPHISGTREAISIKFGMCSAAVGGYVHSKNRLVSSRKHRAKEVRKLRFLSSCQYTHGCYAPASWVARHTTVCLDIAVTKRDVLHGVAKVFDPLGLLVPLTLLGKLFLQKSWRINMPWDEPLSDDLLREWSDIVRSLSRMSNLNIH